MADLVFPGKPTTPSGALNSENLPANSDLVIYKGDYFEMYVTFLDKLSSNPIDLTGQEPKAQLKTNYDDLAPLDFTCTLTNAAGGVVRIYLSSDTTSNLLPGSYIWDFQITDSFNKTRTYIAGDVTVYNEVTT